MRCFFCLAVVLSAAISIASEPSEKPDETLAAAQPAQPVFQGNWSAKSLTLSLGEGKKETFPNEQAPMPFNVLISEKTITLWAGARKFAEMTYRLDSQATPATIDVKYRDFEMPGIYKLDGDKLIIRLSDAKAGRPKDFDAKEISMVMDLKNFRVDPLFMMNADGGDLRSFAAMPDYTASGSPRWSRGGKKIVFDSRRSWCGENFSQSHVFVINADGTAAKDLGDGTLPSMSPDGKQIAYCRYGGEGGIWIMNADGSENHSIDQEGWSADWSPKKEELVYSKSSDGGANLCVLDLKTKETRYLLEKQYQSIDFGLSWSPDGQWVCFKGGLPDGSAEIAIVHAEGEAKGFKVLISKEKLPEAQSFDQFVSWTPDGKRITVPMRMKEDSNHQLYLIDPAGKNPPQRLAGQNPACRQYLSSWSPDGKQIVFSSRPGNPPKKKEPAEKE